MGDGEYCLSDAEALCPLSENGSCLLYEVRPVQCRTFDLGAAESSALWTSVLAPSLERLSLELWLAFVGGMAQDRLPRFALEDVVSRKYVQHLFHLMLAAG